MIQVQQLLAGRDFAKDNIAASQMGNFVYIIADKDAGECVLVDPAWNIKDLLAIVASQKLKLVAVIATHGHFDHVGGRFRGQKVEGIAELWKLAPVPVWANELEIDKIASNTGAPLNALRAVREGDILSVGNSNISFIHTPGHTMGCQCARAENALFTGDTLFVDECGRVDLPGSDPAKMFESLQKLAALPESVEVYPGHNYGAISVSTIRRELKHNPSFKPATLKEWLAYLAEP